MTIIENVESSIAGGGGGGGDDHQFNTTIENNLNPQMYFPNDLTRRQQFCFPKRKAVDLEFSDIKYTVGKFSFSQRKYEKKEILHGISGTFRSGQLSIIMGPSGAGKSTLLNILAGYVQTGVTGNISVNGKHRSSNSESFRNLSAYIHQDDALRPYLTVGESMQFATHLKLGYTVSSNYKNDLIQRILIMLGLEKRYNTYTGCLSGGQKKRLAIALEMINNPPVIFLDEPTTGLDSSSCTQCISLLKGLAQEGRTIVCTIHQPSALIFEMFDKLYALSDGNCLYQGAIKELLPFMSEQGLQCPSYHNPADFLMEIAVSEYECDHTKMMSSALKKYYEDCDKYYMEISEQIYDHSDIEIISPTVETSSTMSMESDEDDKDNENVNVDVDGVVQKVQINDSSNSNKININNQFEMETVFLKNRSVNIKSRPASILMQYILLYQRYFRCSRRNTFLIMSRIIAHIIIAIIFGYLYTNVGTQATTVLANYVYLFGTILLIVYTGKMAVVLSFPLEMEILSREHFNRWYKLGPYYLSIISFEIPFQMFCASLYVLISYYLTGNLYDGYRFYYFIIICLLSTICAQSWGFFVGATLPVKLAVFIGPILAVLFSVFGFCTRYEDMTSMLRWVWHISYFRAGFHGIVDTVYGMNRPYLDCPDKSMYCHFKNPKIFLSMMSVSDDDLDIYNNIMLITGIIIVMHILTIIVLWFKLNKR